MVRIKWFMSSCGQARGIDQPSLVNEKKTVFQVLGSYGHLKARDRVEQLFLHHRRHWNGTSVKSHTLLPEHRHKVPMRDGVSHGLHESLSSLNRLDAVLFSAFNRSLSRLLVTYWQWCYPQKYWALSFSVGPLPRQPSFATQASDLILVCPGFNPCSGAVCSISRIQHTSHGFAGVRARFRLSQFPGRSGKVLGCVGFAQNE